MAKLESITQASSVLEETPTPDVTLSRTAREINMKSNEVLRKPYRLLENLHQNSNIGLYKEKSIVTPKEIKEAFPGDKKLVVCDFALVGSENGKVLVGGFENEGIDNIDHHMPHERMQRFVSSGNLAIATVRRHGVYLPESTQFVIHHTDCDSVISVLIASGVLPPEVRFGDAVIAADHTGAENPIADLLQAIARKRDLEFSTRNLEALLNGLPLDAEAETLLQERLNDRAHLTQIVEDGAFTVTEEGVAFIELEKKIDAGMLPMLLPDAKVIVCGLPMAETPSKIHPWEIKIRLGIAHPQGLALNKMDLPYFGGRWNAGSTKRNGGSPLNVEEYAHLLGKKVREFESR